VLVNRSSKFLSQDRQWLSKMGHPIVPIDRSFEIFGQDGQWFNQMGTSYSAITCTCIL